MIELDRHGEYLHLTWKCWREEVELVFHLPAKYQARNIVRWALPTVSGRGFVFSFEEEPEPTSSNNVNILGVDQGRVLPFVGVVTNPAGAPIAECLPSARLRHASARRENIIVEKQHTAKKRDAYAELGLDTTVLDAQVKCLGSKASRMGQSNAAQSAFEIGRFAQRHKVALIKQENLSFVVGPKRGSLWTHGKTAAAIEHTAARKGVKTERVNARNTSQECSRCGEQVTHNSRTRTVRCKTCAFAWDRDKNAALNIARRSKNTHSDSKNRAIGGVRRARQTGAEQGAEQKTPGTLEVEHCSQFRLLRYCGPDAPMDETPGDGQFP